MRGPVSLVWLLGVALLAGCGVLDGGGATIDRNRLVVDMSKQLGRGAELRYQAEYRLSGGLGAWAGRSVSPSKTAYTYPGGLVVAKEQDVTSCDVAVAPAKCEIRAGTGQLVPYLQAARKGLVTAPLLDDLLRQTSLQPGAEVKGHDTTIAGLQASCLEVLGLMDSVSANFTACVGADGVVASFIGVVEGVSVDQALTGLVLKAPGEEAFALPGKANVVDLRQPASPASIG